MRYSLDHVQAGIVARADVNTVVICQGYIILWVVRMSEQSIAREKTLNHGLLY